MATWGCCMLKRAAGLRGFWQDTLPCCLVGGQHAPNGDHTPLQQSRPVGPEHGSCACGGLQQLAIAETCVAGCACVAGRRAAAG